MCKFSIIVPVYNTEKYLKRCIESLINQSYKNFEVILINDGSTDNSQQVIDNYTSEYSFIKSFKKKNSGVADTRNFGIMNSTGEYIIFVDSDDYISEKMLEILNTKLKLKKYDLIKFNYVDVFDDNVLIYNNQNISFDGTGTEAFKELCLNKKPFDLSCLYAYKKALFIDNKLKFAKDHVHEDFGLIPFLLIISNEVLIIDDNLYFYYNSNNSITRTDDMAKVLKKANDYLFHYDFLKNKIEDIKIDCDSKKLFISYISNAVIQKAKTLSGNELNEYILQMKERKIFDNILADTTFRKIKKFILKNTPKIYFLIFR